MTPRPDWLPDFTWRDVLMALIVAAVFVAMLFSPAATCKVRISDGGTTTTTRVDQ